MVSTGQGEGRSTAADAALRSLEAGIGHFYADRLVEARAEFESVMAAGESRFANHARDYLAACEAASEPKQDEAADPFLLAVMARNDGDLDGALTICAAGEHAEDGRFLYLAACIWALSEESDAALELLGRAVELDPRNRVRAFHDSDFESLHEDERFLSLVHDLGD